MQQRVAHMYTHIPFCPKKCHYCAFVTRVGSLKLVGPYLEAVRTEARQVSERIAGGPLDTVYFGGGTPSLLSPSQIASLLTCFYQHFGLANGCEVTLEAHPDTVTPETLRGYREVGVTRMSFGAESFDPSELSQLGRDSSAESIVRAVEWSSRAGFDNFNLDLMYGLPGQTLASWEATLHRTSGLSPDHLSLYPLSVEPGTVFNRRAGQGSLDFPDDEAVSNMYDLARRHLTADGFQHYEVANWAKPGRRSLHNLACWHDLQYYGLGVGAHAYLHPFRTQNLRQTTRYIERLSVGESPVELREEVTQAMQIQETILLGLRLLDPGLDLRDLHHRFGVDLRALRSDAIENLSYAGLIHLDENYLRLDEAAVPVANEIWERLIA